MILLIHLFFLFSVDQVTFILIRFICKSNSFVVVEIDLVHLKTLSLRERVINKKQLKK